MSKYFQIETDFYKLHPSQENGAFLQRFEDLKRALHEVIKKEHSSSNLKECFGDYADGMYCISLTFDVRIIGLY